MFWGIVIGVVATLVLQVILLAVVIALAKPAPDLRDWRT